ncbi:MAG: outer membrane beta-barrel protein [Bacteroidales bacterium]|nr:outer membrane beta-barrel protein [Bacteroidales bacterium]
MKKIRILWILLGCFGLMAEIHAQSGITVEASQLFASFKFTDAEGTNLNGDYSGIFTGAYNVSYRFVSEGGFMLSIGAGMRKAGATMVYDDMNYNWDLQYADGKLGIGYMLKNDFVSPYLKVSGYYGYLLRGFQTINNQHFDIKKSETINTSDFGLIITPGVQITVTDEISTFFEFNYLMGLKNIEKDESQESKNYAYGLTFGLLFSF